MSIYAYRNENRDGPSILYAKDEIYEDKSVGFYCPNPDCDAHICKKLTAALIDLFVQHQ